MNEFSYSYYENMIQVITNNNIPIVDYSTILKHNPKNFCVIRHDIEFSMDRAFTLAKIENTLGIYSTYNIQLRNNTYNALSDKNIKIAREIHSMGHHIGAHIHMDMYDNNTKISDFIKNDVNTLSEYLGFSIDRFVFHRPWHQWIKNVVECDGLLNLYSTEFFTYYDKKPPAEMEVYFFSDSNHKWKWGNPLENDLKRIRKIQLLIHPYSWTEEGYNNTENIRTLLNEKENEMKYSMNKELVSFPKELL